MPKFVENTCSVCASAFRIVDYVVVERYSLGCHGNWYSCCAIVLCTATSWGKFISLSLSICLYRLIDQSIHPSI